MKSALTRRLYVITWLMLGAIAIGYFISLFQTAGASRIAQSQDSQPSDKAGPEKTADTQDPGISKAIVRMRSEIARLKESLESANRVNEALKAHIETLESTFGTTTAALPREPEKPKPETESREKTSSDSSPAPKVEIVTMPMPADGFENTLEDSPLPIAGQTRPKRTQFAVELAAGLSPKDVEVRWLEFKAQHSKMLAELQPRAIKVDGDRGRTYKLIVGPFNNAAAAARLCARLNAAGTKCDGAVFSGEPLETIAAR